MASFRFIHAADIHLDSPLKGLAGHEGAASELIQTATREAFDNLISLAIEEDVSFVVIAGDLYDGDWKDYQTGLFFIKQVGRLASAEIPLFVAYGNHDAESQITRSLALPENASVFSSKQPSTFELDEIEVALHGQSYRQRDISDNLVPAYPEPIPGKFNIGVLHTGLGGLGGHENYAPCSLEELIAKGYDYWALGHVHKADVLNEQPHVVFPGNLQGRHIRETGAKGAALVTVDAGSVSDIEPVRTDVVRWASLKVDVEGCTRMDGVIEQVGRAIEGQVASEADGRLLACRVVFEGATELHGRLLASRDHLFAEARAAALGLGEDVAWIEKVDLATTLPPDQASLRDREDALGQLRRLMEQAGEDDSLLEQVRTDIGDFVSKLPHEIRAEAEEPILRASIEGDNESLFEAAAEYLVARLSGEEQ